MVDEKCTVLFPSFETIWMQVLTHPDFNTDDFGAARLVLNVGVPERLEMMQRLLPHVPQVSNTGCTEVGGFLCIGRQTDSLESRTTTAGPVLSEMEAKIVDPATGAELPAGREGELLVRGPSCLSEYYRDPEATRTAIEPDGWFHTGDLLRRTEAGEYVFASRIKDMLKVGGQYISPVTLEEVLRSHPAVADCAVVACLVGGLERPAAHLVLKPGFSAGAALEKDLRAHAAAHLADYMRPLKYAFLDDLPRNSSGKVQRFKLKQ